MNCFKQKKTSSEMEACFSIRVHIIFLKLGVGASVRNTIAIFTTVDAGTDSTPPLASMTTGFS